MSHVSQASVDKSQSNRSGFETLVWEHWENMCGESQSNRSGFETNESTMNWGASETSQSNRSGFETCPV